MAAVSTNGAQNLSSLFQRLFIFKDLQAYCAPRNN
jgi:hypothetical protein